MVLSILRRTPVTLFLSAALSAAGLSGCATAQRLSEVGDAPGFTPINVPSATAAPVGIQTAHAPQTLDSSQYRTVPQQTIVTPSVQTASATNSLWQPGARSFFRDPRASRVGDILTVQIAITDSAQIADNTARSRQSSEKSTLTNFLGMSSTAVGLANGLSKNASGGNTADLANFGGDSSLSGTGSIQRSETITTTVAAVVQQILPNGNLVIDGRQEVRVNNEMRELTVSGVVRPEDITNANTINQAQIAEARISYGGRGQISDVQKPGIGQEIFDLISPF
jgi:flagellar L-ring protein precursor FlgH